MTNFPSKIPLKGRAKHCVLFTKQLNLQKKVVVDIGSSFGWIEKELLGSGAKLTGIEPNSDAVEFATKRMGKKAEFILGDALSLPLANESTDIVLFFDVIEHVPSRQELNALKEINRVLKKRGTLLLSTPNDHFINNILDPAWYFGHRHYSFKKLSAFLKKSGFKIQYSGKRGGVLSLLYMIWFYILTTIFKIPQPRNNLFENLYDFSYESDTGFVTHYIMAKKI